MGMMACSTMLESSEDVVNIKYLLSHHEDVFYNKITVLSNYVHIKYTDIFMIL